MKFKLFQRFFQPTPVAPPPSSFVIVDDRREHWFKWNTGEFAATLRYLHYGTATTGINETYAREVKNFIKSDDVMIGMIRPPETKGAVDDDFIFWGARSVSTPKPERCAILSSTVLSWLCKPSSSEPEL